MTSKILFKNMYQMESKRNRWILIVGTLAMMFCLPFQFLQKIKEFEEIYGMQFCKITKELLYEQTDILNSLTYRNNIMFIVIIGLAMINGIFLYRYLSSRKQLDFYFSQPMKRASLFWCSYLQGIVNMAIPLAISYVLVLLMAGANGCLSGKFVLIVIQVYVTAMVYYAVVFTTAVLASILTGNSLFSILGFGVLCGYFPIINGIYFIEYHMVDNAVGEAISYVSYLSPVAAFSELMAKWNNRLYDFTDSGLHYLSFHWGLFVYVLILFAVLLVSARVLYVKRSAESAGKCVAFQKAKGIIKGFLIVAFSLVCSVMLAEFFLSKSLSYKIVGFVVGLFVGLYILDAMLELRWNAFFKNPKRQIKYIVIATAVFASFLLYGESVRYKGFDEYGKNYTQEDAEQDGVVVLENCEIVANKDVLFQFIENTADGVEGNITLMECHERESYFMNVEYKKGIYKIRNSYNEYDTGEQYKYLVYLNGLDEHSNVEREFVVATDLEDLTFEDMRSLYYPTEEEWNSDEENRRDIGRFHVIYEGTVTE